MLMRSMMRANPRETNEPTPMAIMTTRNRGEMLESTPLTCVASTWTSGSAMVITNPMRKPRTSINGMFLRCVSADPTCSPTGTIPMSAPRRKIDNPRVSRAPPMRKLQNMSMGSGATVKWRITTMTMMGTTETSVSLSLDRRFTDWMLLGV